MTDTTQGSAQGYLADPRNEQVLVYLNGDFVPRDQARVSVFDAGFGLGDGVWEGLRLHRGRLISLQAHLDRLYEGARSIAIDIGMSRAQLTDALMQTLAKNGMNDGAHLRLMITRGVKRTVNQDPRFVIGPPTVVIVAEYKTPRPESKARGMTLFTSTFRTSGPDVFDLRLNSHSRINLIGLQSGDVLGGITVADAGREAGSTAVVHQAIQKGTLAAHKVGRLLVIPHEAWAAWKARHAAPPEGWVRLSTLRQPLGIRSDKLSEFARMGYVPGAVRCNPFGVPGPSTQFGTWYIDPKTAGRLLADRRAGRPMPWHGKPLLDNLRVTYKLWAQRRHPATCATCAAIWGEAGPPADFEDYVARYPALAHGAKRHLTLPWSPGLTVADPPSSRGGPPKPPAISRAQHELSARKG